MDEALGDFAEGAVEFGQINLGVVTAQRDQLAAAGEEFRGAAFVAMNMRLVMAQDGAMRRTQDGQGQRVRSRS